MQQTIRLPCAVFLDKDGTLVEDVPWEADPDRVQFTPGALEGLLRLHRAGYRLIVISNQAGVAMGHIAESQLTAVEARLRRLLAAEGIPLAGFYYCPHHPQGTVARYAIECTCRKPRPGLILRAARERGIDLAGSWFLGDILDDVEAGHRAGCRSILVDRGGETQWLPGPERRPDALASDLVEAARLILVPVVAEAQGGGP